MAWTPRVIDHFTDADFTLLQDHTPDLGGAWSPDNGLLQIISNAVTSNFAIGVGYYRNLTTLAAKQYAQFVVGSASSFPGLLLSCDVSGGGDFTGYWLVVNSTVSVLLRKFTGSGVAFTAEATFTAVADTDTLRLEFDGVDTFDQYINGIFTDTYTDGSPSVNPYAGVFGTFAVGQLDDFEAGDESAPPSGGWGPLLGQQRNRLVRARQSRPRDRYTRDGVTGLYLPSSAKRAA